MFLCFLVMTLVGSKGIVVGQKMYSEAKRGVDIAKSGECVVFEDQDVTPFYDLNGSVNGYAEDIVFVPMRNIYNI